LDDLGANRREMMMALPMFLGELEDAARRNVEGQLGFFDLVPMQAAGGRENGEPKVPPQTEFSHTDLLAYEKETMGFYLSGHPMSKLDELAKRLGSAKISELTDSANEGGQGFYRDNEEVRLLCVIVGVKKKIVKNNATMAFLTVEDLHGQMEALVFPSTLERYANLFSDGRTVLVGGRLSLQEDKEAKLICNTIEDCGDADGSPAPEQKKSGRRGVFLRFNSKEDPLVAKAETLLDIFAGDFPDSGTPVQFYFDDVKQYQKRPGTDWNPVLARTLMELLGANNVVANV